MLGLQHNLLKLLSLMLASRNNKDYSITGTITQFVVFENVRRRGLEWTQDRCKEPDDVSPD